MNKKGFTLLELITVISIIGLLANSVFASVFVARASARDVVRLNDLKAIASAFHQYNIDNGGYPDKEDYEALSGTTLTVERWTEGECIGDGALCGFVAGEGTNYLEDLLRPYLDPIPKDPLHDCPDTASGSDIEVTTVCDESYFYFYDYSHAIRECPSGPTLCGGDAECGAVVLGANKFETTKYRDFAQKDICLGIDGNLDLGEYSVILCSGLTDDCGIDAGLPPT